MGAFSVVHVKAPNDVHGNPRRGFLVMRDQSVSFYEEGYLGEQAVPQYVRDAGITWVALAVSVGEYRRMVKVYGRSS